MDVIDVGDVIRECIIDTRLLHCSYLTSRPQITAGNLQ